VRLIAAKEKEEKLVELGFNIHKFNARPKPIDPKRILIISAFSEFGCETLGILYCIPRIMMQHPGHYIIVMGWYGREYLYRHLVDEFWELKEEFQWLRDYAKAFHNDSKNIAKLEESVKSLGMLYPCKILAMDVVFNRCNTCKKVFNINEGTDKCPVCGSEDILKALFSDVNFWKKLAIKVPSPSKEATSKIEKYLKPNMVGIFARGRSTYNRNLQPDFYEKLIYLLEKMGYNPIWLGEKQSTQPCPVDHIVDFSRMPESRDLEQTLAIVSKCEFTIQFWTASTRLAGIMGVPYLLFESPDQIFGNGQEGYRRNLCDFGLRKLCISHFINVYENHEKALEVVQQCIKEMENGDYKDVFGLIDRQEVVEEMRNQNKQRIGG
jgi:hypothetical protein